MDLDEKRRYQFSRAWQPETFLRYGLKEDDKVKRKSDKERRAIAQDSVPEEFLWSKSPRLTATGTQKLLEPLTLRSINQAMVSNFELSAINMNST